MSSLAIVAFSIFASPFQPSALPTFFLLTRWPHLSLLATLLGSVYEFCLESLPIRKIKLIVFLRGSRAILRLCVLSHFILILQPDVFSRLIRINRNRSQKSFVSVDVINSGQLAPRRMTKTTQKKPRYRLRDIASYKRHLNAFCRENQVFVAMRHTSETLKQFSILH